MKEFLCETQELAIGYGKTPLASGIALGANPGQILVLVGPNGAGKSTLLKTLAGQLAIRLRSSLLFISSSTVQLRSLAICSTMG